MAKEVLEHGVVIYTDGSARPNPGFYGSGLHGYVYALLDANDKPTKINALITTDKGYIYQKDLDKTDARPVQVTRYLDSFSASLEQGTNNIAEIDAVSLFFEHYEDIAKTIETLYILTDSEYVVKGVTEWIEGWKRRGWMTSNMTPVSNQASWMRLDSHLQDFSRRANYEIAWVRGHNDDFGNVKADYLAGIGTNHSTDNKDTQFKVVSDPLRYHKCDETLHPFLGLKRIYFNTDPKFNEPGVYYQTGWSGTDFIVGKRTSEAAFSVVKLSTPDPLVEEIIQAQYNAPSTFNSIVYAKIDRIKSPDVLPYLVTHGRYSLSCDKRNLNLNFLDRKPVTIEVRPGELPLYAIDVLNHLEQLLETLEEHYLKHQTYSGVSTELYTLHDITSHFYEKGEKFVGKKAVPTTTLKKDFGVGVKKTEIEISQEIVEENKSFKLPLIFTDDIPSRNTFKHLEEHHPTVYLVTWKDAEKVLRYSTVIKTEEAVGIWSNYFANMVYF